MKKIALFAMGGTISAKGYNRRDLKDYQSGMISGADFLEAMPELGELAEIDVIQVDNVSSTKMNEHHWLRLKNQLEFYLNDKWYDGAVLTQGTSTLEETAYFLYLTVDSSKPIVLVGAQRPFTALSTDAHMNLLNAVRVAVAPASHDKGVLVVANDEIHSAREVTKTHTYRLGTFQSGEFGLLGFVDPDETVQFYREPTRRHTTHSELTAINTTHFPRVEIVYSYAGATGELIDFIVQSGKYDGVVVAGTGAGRFSQSEETALKRARKQGLAVVRSSRVGNGRVIDIEPYEYLKTISSDNLLPQKARILLMLSLIRYSDIVQLRGMFRIY